MSTTTRPQTPLVSSLQVHLVCSIHERLARMPLAAIAESRGPALAEVQFADLVMSHHARRPLAERLAVLASTLACTLDYWLHCAQGERIDAPLIRELHALRNHDPLGFADVDAAVRRLGWRQFHRFRSLSVLRRLIADASAEDGRPVAVVVHGEQDDRDAFDCSSAIEMLWASGHRVVLREGPAEVQRGARLGPSRVG